MQQYTQTDAIVDMTHAIMMFEAEDLAATIRCAMAFNVEIGRVVDPSLYDMTQYLDFLENIGFQWTNARQMILHKKGTEKFLKQALALAHKMENWVI